MKRPLSRLIVVLCFVAAGGLFVWQQMKGPVSTQLTFVLTDLEAPHDGRLYRHEHVSAIACDVLDEAGQSVARIEHRAPGAIAHPAPLHLPPGTYSFRVTLTFGAAASPRFTRSYLQQHELNGDPLSIRL